MKKTFIFFIIHLIFIGCTGDESKRKSQSLNEDSTLESYSTIDSINGEKLLNKYGALIKWDTLKFTYQLQENLIEKNAAINADVLDIIKVDTSYYVRLINKYLFLHNRKSSFNQVSAYLKINKNQLSVLQNVPMSWRNKFGRGRTGVFIFKATSISNRTNKIINLEFDSETGESSNVEENENILLFNGHLIDYYLFKSPY
jgi:hypothetical protein